MKDPDFYKAETCAAHHLAIRDTMEVLNGKWKIKIIASLSLGEKRFMELKDKVEGIASKMLSKELYELEINGLVKRTVLKTKPISVAYSLTDYGYTLEPLIDEMASWGKKHRERVAFEMKAGSGSENF